MFRRSKTADTTTSTAAATAGTGSTRKSGSKQATGSTSTSRSSGSTAYTGAAAPTPASGAVREGTKGRPTPSRREAEAASRARAKGPQDRRSTARMNRQQRAEHNARAREGMRSGDDRFLPTRDKGPVRRFVRDYVDARLCMAELLLPLLLLILLTSLVNSNLSNGLWSATILVVAVDTAWLVIRLRRELPRRFPDRSTRGAVGYGLLRSLQVRFFRLPKPQVKLGAKLTGRY